MYSGALAQASDWSPAWPRLILLGRPWMLDTTIVKRHESARGAACHSRLQLQSAVAWSYPSAHGRVSEL